MNLKLNRLKNIEVSSAIAAGVLLLFSGGIYVFAAPVAPEFAGNIASLTPDVIFKKALQDDLSGRQELARKEYDSLKNTPLVAVSAVPSAVNLVALKRFDDAKSALSLIQHGANKHDASYARLWQLWLIAHNQTQSKELMKSQLVKTAKDYKADSAVRQEIINLYAGKGNVEKVFTAISSDTSLSEFQRRDATTEATFFAGSYLRYVAGDIPAARKLYQEKAELLNPVSLENTFITQEMTAL